VIAADGEVVKLEWGCRYEPGGLRLLPFTLPHLPAGAGWETIDGCGVSHERLDAALDGVIVLHLSNAAPLASRDEPPEEPDP
jgi:hypothetical protein